MFEVISELHYFSEHMRRNWTDLFERSSRSGVEIGCGNRVVPLGLVLPVAACIYMQLFACQKTLTVEQAASYCESAECTSSFYEE